MGTAPATLRRRSRRQPSDSLAGPLERYWAGQETRLRGSSDGLLEHPSNGKRVRGRNRCRIVKFRRRVDDLAAEICDFDANLAVHHRHWHQGPRKSSPMDCDLADAGRAREFEHQTPQRVPRIRGGQNCEGVSRSALLHDDRHQSGICRTGLEKRGEHARPDPRIQVIDIALQDRQDRLESGVRA